MGINSYIFNLLHSLAWRDPLFDFVVIFSARYLQYFVIAYAVIHIFRRMNSKQADVKPFFVLKKVFRECFRIFVIMSFSWVLCSILKFWIHAPRPFVINSSLQPLFYYGEYTSFPSGHAVILTALVYVMYKFRKETLRIMLPAVAIILIARVIAGVHFPIDILVGAILGLTISYTVLHLEDRIIKKNDNI